MKKLGLIMLIGSMLIASILLPNSNLITDFSDYNYEDGIEIFKNQVNELGQNVEKSIVATLQSFETVQNTIKSVFDFLGGDNERYDFTYSKDYFNLYRDKWVLASLQGRFVAEEPSYIFVYSGDIFFNGEAIVREIYYDGEPRYFDVNIILGVWIYENFGGPLTDEQMLEFEIRYLME